MRQADEFAFDPDVVATLDAIDATLAGEAVDPQYAEMAELALLVAAERPAIDTAFAQVLDDSVSRRFTASTAKPSSGAARRRRGSLWVWGPSAALAASLAIAVVIVLGGGGNSGVTNGPPEGFGTAASGASSAASAPAVKRAAAGGGVPAPAAGHSHAAQSRGREKLGGGSAAASGAFTPSIQSVAGANTLQAAPPAQNLALPYTGPATTDRKVVQGAQLSLSTSPRRVDQVAQEVFNVVAQQKGIVKTSRVTANGTLGGSAEFELGVPNSNLSATMSALSSLQYARVASRTDTSQDVTNQYRVDQRHLADDQALRTSLLKQLANAVTQEQVDSLTARIHDAEGAIGRDESVLKSLNRQVSFSQIYVTINAGAVPVPLHSSGGGFTLSKAAHDAGHVLTVAAGVALIVLAALVPLALVFALMWWIWSTLRRRRRLQALDLY